MRCGAMAWICGSLMKSCNAFPVGPLAGAGAAKGEGGALALAAKVDVTKRVASESRRRNFILRVGIANKER